MFSKYIDAAKNVFSGNARKETISMNGVDVAFDDEKAIRELCQKVFPASGQLSSPDTLWQFNTVLVQVAEEFIVKPNFEKIFGTFATTKQVDKNTSLVDFVVEKDYNINFSLIASNSGHKLVKIGDSRRIVQSPFTIGFGVTYDPMTKTDDEIEWFNKAVKEIGRAEIAYIYNKCLDLLSASDALPAKNVVEGSNITYAQVKDLAAVIRRRTGGRPVLLGDEVLLNSIGEGMVADGHTGKLIWDGLAEELFGAYAPKNFGTFDGVATENPYIDDQNTKTALPVNEGIMYAASGKYRPIAVTKIGGMIQKTNTELKNDRVQMYVEQELAITLLYPQLIGKVTDDALSL